MAERLSYADHLRDLLLGGVGASWAAWLAGTTYWAELTTGSIRCQAEALDCLVAAVRDPRRGDGALASLTDRLKKCVERSVDSSERAIMQFNQEFQAFARGIRGASPPGASITEVRSRELIDELRHLLDTVVRDVLRSPDTRTRPDLRAFRQVLERTLSEIRRLESTAAASPPDAGSSASAAQRV